MERRICRAWGCWAPPKELSSSTTPDSAAGIDRARAKRNLEVFTRDTHDNLRTDMSRGRGKYLTSLASIAGVPAERQSRFDLHMRDSYATLFDDAVASNESTESTARIVEAVWIAGVWAALGVRTVPRGLL
ncbi:MAG: hypothetical protein NTNFB02_16430 [Nitrospira sp.]